MRFALDIAETGSRPSPSSNSVSKADLVWVQLQRHPLFSSGFAAPLTEGMLSNIIAWDGASRLYIWDLKKKCIHRIAVRLGEPDPSSVVAGSPSNLLQPDVPLNFEVNRIAINGNGSALLLVGLEGLQVMYLYGRPSIEENTIICRTVPIGSDTYFSRSTPIRVLQVSWHPCSDTHLGILSCDCVFRIFDLSTDLGKPEQEFYLQPLEPRISAHVAAICPVDFSFGGEHLWDRFSVFILFSDGSCYIICPVVPFGSVYKWESILELYHDAQTIGLKSSDPEAVIDAHTAISWLEATFPGLAQQLPDGGKPYVLKARPFVFMNSSVALQGPLRNIRHDAKDLNGDNNGVFEGPAISFLYNLVGKDSILVTALGCGQLLIDALADEIQPVWNSGSSPRIFVSSSDQTLGAAMICEPSSSKERSLMKLDDHPSPTVWLGHPPPLLRLAMVDFSLSKKPTPSLAMIPDPLVRERIFCIHSGGIDSVVLHFLPFTNMTTSSNLKQVRPPSVLAVLNTGTEDVSLPAPLRCCLPLSDSFGNSWIVGITYLNECLVLPMETWKVLLTDIGDKMRETLISNRGKENTEAPYTIISKELLVGPKPILLPSSAASTRMLGADSIEGRSTLHQYFKLFHENYMEYAHKVYFEFQYHGPHMKRMIENQSSRLREMQQKLLEVEGKHVKKMEDRIDDALKRHASLEERLMKLRNLRGLHKAPLSKAERHFKSELDRLTEVDLDALHSTVDALNSRLKKHRQSPQGKSWLRTREDDVYQQLKSWVEKLSVLNKENMRRVKLIECSSFLNQSSDKDGEEEHRH